MNIRHVRQNYIDCKRGAVNATSKILSTCDLCRIDNVFRTIMFKDLDQGSANGCGFCHVMSRGLGLLEQQLSRNLGGSTWSSGSFFISQENTIDVHFNFKVDISLEKDSPPWPCEFEAFLDVSNAGVHSHSTDPSVSFYNSSRNIPNRQSSSLLRRYDRARTSTGCTSSPEMDFEL